MKAPPTAVKPWLSTGRQYPDGFVMYDADQQAVFALPMIGARPLPSIPNGSTERCRGPDAMGSMQFACTCHTHPRPPPQLAAKVRSIGTGPNGQCGWGGMGEGTSTSSPRYSNTELPYSSPDDQHHSFVPGSNLVT